MDAVKDLSGLSGYGDKKELLAQRYTLAGKSVFVVALPLNLVPTHLPIPDPEQPFPGNRRVSVSHAVKFGEYWRSNTKCATPPLLLDTVWPLTKDFEPKYKAGGVEFGVLRLPHASAKALEILDGQHRILGWTRIHDTMNEELKSALENYSLAVTTGDPDSQALWQAKIQSIESDLDRMRSEFVTLEIIEGLTQDEHKQLFADIANHAKGITKSVTVAFDRRSVLNRVAIQIAEDAPLLAGRVDFEKDRVAGSNPAFISGRNLSDLVRHVAVGIDGRMTARRESRFSETQIESLVMDFFEVLVDSFPSLQNLADDESVSAAELREVSLLGSPTILRCLAGAYHSLAVVGLEDDKPMASSAGVKRAKKLFSELAPHMGLPISEEWFATQYFPEKSSKAPSSRAQDLRGLTETMVAWADDGIFTEDK